MKKKKRKGNAFNVQPAYSDERWETERDMEAIARADAVKGCPERMEKVKKMAAERLEDSKRKKEEAQKMIELGSGV